MEISRWCKPPDHRETKAQAPGRGGENSSRRKPAMATFQIDYRKGELDLVAILKEFHVQMRTSYAIFVAKTFFPGELVPAEEFYARLTKEIQERHPTARMIFYRKKPEFIPGPGGKMSLKMNIMMVPNDVFADLGIRGSNRSAAILQTNLVTLASGGHDQLPASLRHLILRAARPSRRFFRRYDRGRDGRGRAASRRPAMRAVRYRPRRCGPSRGAMGYSTRRIVNRR